MSNFDNKNRIGLWLNDRRTEQSHSHLSGHGETDAPVWASGYFAKDIAPDDQRLLMDIVKRHRAISNRAFINVTLKAKGEQGKPAEREAPPAPEFDDSSELPF